MAAGHLFEKTLSVLQNDKDFLNANVPTLKPGHQAISSLIPQISRVIDRLTDLMWELNTIIRNHYIDSIPGLPYISNFAERVVHAHRSNAA